MQFELTREQKISKFLMEYEDCTMNKRQADAIAKYFVQTNADPLVGELEAEVAKCRQEFAAQLLTIRQKNSESVSLQNKYSAALAEVSRLKRITK